MKEIPASKTCFVCGLENPTGLRIHFYYDGKEAKGEFLPDSRWEGYPGIVHGGILSSLLDEIMYKAVFSEVGNVVTAKIEVRFRQPAQVGEKLYLTGQMGERKKRFATAKGRLVNSEGKVIASAEGMFHLLNEQGEKKFRVDLL